MTVATFLSGRWTGWRSTLGLACAGVALLALIAANDDASAQATGIRSTKHNLSSTGVGGNNHVTGSDNITGTADVCVFCHTPHAASLPAGVEAPPLWNKRIPTGATYQTYEQLNSASIDGEILTVGSISVACLSCHDGTQAMDNIINAPGSGLGPLTADAGGGANGLGYTWASTNGSLDAGGFGRLVAGAAAIGTDLRNDHPIGIEYCGGWNGTTCKDPDFVTPQTRTITTQAGTTITQNWVDSSIGTAGSREKTDMPLYARAFTAGTRPSVECGSCHDPHVDGTGNSGATFLRVKNDGSAVCLTCHVK